MSVPGYRAVRAVVLAQGLTISERGLIHWEIYKPGTKQAIFRGTLNQIDVWLEMRAKKVERERTKPAKHVRAIRRAHRFGAI